MWVRRFQLEPQSKVRLICFPHAGGSASYYSPFTAHLSPQVEVLAIQYPGRQERFLETRIESIPELADAVSSALLQWRDRPFALFGHSMGAFVAFEVARRMQERGVSPLSTFLSGAPAPSHRPHKTLHLLDESDLAAELCRMGGTNPELLADQDMQAMILPIARGDIKALETYACAAGAKLDCPIWAFVGTADAEAPVEDAAAWREYTTSDFELKVFPGGHFYLDACRQDVLATVSDMLMKHCRAAPGNLTPRRPRNGA
jgi:surfactin synthase thioesterase subunit